MDKNNKYKHYYVPQCLVKKWSRDGEHAAWYNAVYEKSIPNGRNTRYFHSDLISLSPALEMTIERLNLLFNNYLDYFIEGDFSPLKSGELMSAREVIMFLLLENSIRANSFNSLISNLKMEFDSLLNASSRKEREQLKRTTEIKTALNEMVIYGVDLLDLDAVLLEAPEGRSFLLGSSPVTLINPYLAEANPVWYPELEAYETWGSVIVLPLTPDKALCLYDGETYIPQPSGSSLKLTEEDIDMLNSAIVYNSGEYGGVIHISGEDYINELFEGLDEDDNFRDSILGSGLDEYPFSTILSVLKIKKEAEEKIKEREDDPIRPYIQKIVDYDDIHLEKMKGKDSVKVYSKRLDDILKILDDMKR